MAMSQPTTTKYPCDMTTKKFQSMNLEPSAIEEIRRLARWLSVEADRNVPLSEAVSAAIAEARMHSENLVQRVTSPAEEGVPDD